MQLPIGKRIRIFAWWAPWAPAPWLVFSRHLIGYSERMVPLEGWAISFGPLVLGWEREIEKG